MKRDLEAQAIEALKAVLQDVSVIKLREIRTKSGLRRGGQKSLRTLTFTVIIAFVLQGEGKQRDRSREAQFTGVAYASQKP